MGRPTKYDAKIHPGIVRKLSSVGMTDEDMAEVLEIGVRTFYDWKDAHPEFSQAVTEGKQNPIRDVEDALYRLCKGYTYKEDSGQGIRIEKVKHPDVRAIQFYLKNVAPDRWRDMQHHEHTGKDGGPIEHSIIGALRDRLSDRRGEEGTSKPSREGSESS